MRNMLLPLASALALPFFGLTASAAVILEYQANPETPDPINQTNPGGVIWTASGNYNPPPAPTDDPILPSFGEETLNGREWGYWEMSNMGKRSNYSLLYRGNISAPTFAASEGWTATTTLRVLSAADAFNSLYLQVSDGSTSWEVSFIRTSPTVSYIARRDQSGALVKMEDFDLAADFFTLQLYFDPQTSTVTYYINGRELAQNAVATRAGSSTALANQLYLRWGDNSGGATAVRTNAQWNEVRFETGYAVVPEPGTVALVTCGAIGVSLTRFLKRK